jgi:hypothetical protein
MKTWHLVIRITVLMLIIFASGVWVGRRWAPEPALEMRADPAVIERLPSNVRKVTARYIAELELNEAQQKQVVPLIEKAARELVKLPKNSPQRLAALERFHDDLARHLTKEQREKALAILEAARSRVDE